MNVDRLFACFSSRNRARLCAVLSAFRIKRLCSPGLRSIACICILCLASAVIFFVWQGKFAWGQSPETPDAVNPEYEYNVKAAFLYSYGRYVEWPKDSFAERSSPFVIGVCGEDPFAQVLDRIAQSKTIQGRHIVIQKMATIEDLQPCHILFVASSIPFPKQVALIDKMRNKPTLLVGESPGFADHGGGINFFVEAGTVRFEINAEAIRQKNLIMDAKLLNLGKKVPETGQAKNSNAP